MKSQIKQQSALRSIRSSQAEYYKNMFLPHMDPSFQAKFTALMDLIKSSADAGGVTRGRLNAALYPASTPDSIKSQLQAFKKALSEAGESCGHILELATKKGRGNDNQIILLKTDAPSPVPGITRAKADFTARQQHKNVPAGFIDLDERTVFISYAWNDHKKEDIRALAEWLKGQKGIEVVYDQQYSNRPPDKGWQAWMLHSIEEADVVLCICGEVYKNGFEKRNIGSMGVAWEGAIVNIDMYENNGINSKYYPILPAAGAYECIPTHLKSWNNDIVLTDRERILALIRDKKKKVSSDTTHLHKNLGRSLLPRGRSLEALEAINKENVRAYATEVSMR